jgi:hypothetical protein
MHASAHRLTLPALHRCLSATMASLSVRSSRSRNDSRPTARIFWRMTPRRCAGIACEPVRSDGGASRWHRSAPFFRERDPGSSRTAAVGTGVTTAYCRVGGEREDATPRNAGRNCCERGAKWPIHAVACRCRRGTPACSPLEFPSHSCRQTGVTT